MSSYDYQAPPASYFSTTMEENDDLHWAIENDPPRRHVLERRLRVHQL